MGKPSKVATHESLFDNYVGLSHQSNWMRAHPERLIRNDPTTYAPLNEQAAEKSATILFRDGKSFVVDGLIVKEDSVSWTSRTDRSRHHAPISAIDRVKIRLTDSGKGTMFLGGAVTGAVFFGLGGWITSEESEITSFETVYGAGAGFVLGGLAGLAVPSATREAIYRFKRKGSHRKEPFSCRELHSSSESIIANTSLLAGNILKLLLTWGFTALKKAPMAKGLCRVP